MLSTAYEPLSFQGFGGLHFTVERLYYKSKVAKIPDLEVSEHDNRQGTCSL
jgi:hypothetical protein